MKINIDNSNIHRSNSTNQSAFLKSDIFTIREEILPSLRGQMDYCKGVNFKLKLLTCEENIVRFQVAKILYE